MHPVIGHGATKSTFRLGNFVFVVRKFKVWATTMNIERHAQQFVTHGRTLDVPTRTALTVRRRPFAIVGLARLCCFPKYKIEWVLLARRWCDPLAGTQVVECFTR